LSERSSTLECKLFTWFEDVDDRDDVEEDESDDAAILLRNPRAESESDEEVVGVEEGSEVVVALNVGCCDVDPGINVDIDSEDVGEELLRSAYPSLFIVTLSSGIVVSSCCLISSSLN